MQPRSRSVLRRLGLSECPNDVAVEGSGDELVDGEVILSFHEWSGVEIGHSSIFAEAGEDSMLLFSGYEEHRDFSTGNGFGLQKRTSD